jgi:hypothetical protein
MSTPVLTVYTVFHVCLPLCPPGLPSFYKPPAFVLMVGQSAPLLAFFLPAGVSAVISGNTIRRFCP